MSETWEERSRRGWEIDDDEVMEAEEGGGRVSKL